MKYIRGIMELHLHNEKVPIANLITTYFIFSRKKHSVK